MRCSSAGGSIWLLIRGPWVRVPPSQLSSYLIQVRIWIRYLACNNGWNKRSSNAPKNVGVRQIAERVFPQPSYDIRSLKFQKLKKMPAYVGIKIIRVESRESKTRKPWLGKLPPPFGVGQRVAIWASGGTGRRTRLRIWRETVWVQFPPCPLRRNPHN